jgi:hypothetical protein
MRGLAVRHVLFTEGIEDVPRGNGNEFLGRNVFDL